MSEKPYFPDDPEFLASRALDEDLSTDEQQRLEEELAVSDELRAEAKLLGAVDHLIRQWGGDEVELDWETYAKLVQARIESLGEEEDLHKVDEVLAQWAATRAETDGERFIATVMRRVRAEAPQRSWRGVVFRIGTPLAAAAAVAIAVTASFWSAASRETVCEVTVGPGTCLVEASPSAVVRFDRTPVERAEGEGQTPRMSLLAMGSSPVIAESPEAPPL